MKKINFIFEIFVGGREEKYERITLFVVGMNIAM